MSTRTPIGIAALALTLLAAAGCADVDGGTPHPTDRLDYPVSVTADPGGRVVWVTSGNFDLAYRGGAVLAIDVADNTFIEGSAFEVGGFPGPLTILERDGEAVAGYILSRDSDALYHVAFDGPVQAPTVSCPGGSRSGGQGIYRCGSAAAIDKATVRDDDESVELSVGPDPFGALVRRARAEREPDLLLTGAMLDGNVATFELDEEGTPKLVGAFNLLGGLYAFAESPTSGRIYTTSKTVNAIQVLAIEVPDQGAEVNLDNPYVKLVGQLVVPENLAVDRARDVAISADGTRLYAAYRSPDTLLVVDLTEDAGGEPADRILGKIPLSEDPGDILVIPGPTGDNERVYVSCFGAGRVEVVDPFAGRVIDTIRTGRGPFGMAYVDNADLDIRRLYVANFYDDSVGVIELDPSSPYYHTQVAEIR